LSTKFPSQLIILSLVCKRAPTHFQHFLESDTAFCGVLAETLDCSRFDFVFDFLPAACKGGYCCLCGKKKD